MDRCKKEEAIRKKKIKKEKRKKEFRIKKVLTGKNILRTTNKIT